jgi:hypothetical protein
MKLKTCLMHIFYHIRGNPNIRTIEGERMEKVTPNAEPRTCERIRETTYGGKSS